MNLETKTIYHFLCTLRCKLLIIHFIKKLFLYNNMHVDSLLLSGGMSRETSLLLTFWNAIKANHWTDVTKCWKHIHIHMYIVYIIWTNQCTYWNTEKKIRLNRNFIQRKQSAWTLTADERYEKGSNWNLHIITSQVMITQITPFTWFRWCF